MLLLLLLYVGWNSLMTGEEASDSAGDLAAPDIEAEAPIPVRVARAERRDLIIRISATGITRALRQLKVMARVAGPVARLYVKEGDRLSAGDTLFVLEGTDYRLALREAEEQLKQATLKYGEQLGERRHAMIQAGGESLLDLEEARRQIEQAKQALAEGRMSAYEFQLIEREYAAAKMFAKRIRKPLSPRAADSRRPCLPLKKPA
ncbi:MAG: biotin/lipoyl-binding protein [candidate division KSB1 bacterium]|nr:biotin/lipoyl-binding protein [candidate division KSB1 bacterium]